MFFASRPTPLLATHSKAPESAPLTFLTSRYTLSETLVVTVLQWGLSLTLTPLHSKDNLIYRVIHQVRTNLLLTRFRQSWQLVGRYCSYLLPRQVDGTFQTQVNRRFLTL